MINWKVRIKNKYFWLAIIPAVIYFLDTILSWFGISMPIDYLIGEAEKFIEALFWILIFLGIANDHTVTGLSDSKDALKRNKPKDDQYYIR